MLSRLKTAMRYSSNALWLRRYTSATHTCERSSQPPLSPMCHRSKKTLLEMFSVYCAIWFNVAYICSLCNRQRENHFKRVFLNWCGINRAYLEMSTKLIPHLDVLSCAKFLSNPSEKSYKTLSKYCRNVFLQNIQQIEQYLFYIEIQPTTFS